MDRIGGAQRMDLESLTRLIYDGLGDGYHRGNFSHAVAPIRRHDESRAFDPAFRSRQTGDDTVRHDM
ncbi:MAG: hypothetical protein V3U27_20240 [Candidatus Tectomicrobia bacterium]